MTTKQMTTTSTRTTSNCSHKRTTILTSGSFHFSGGEVWDDLEETVYCLDCQTEIVPDLDDSGDDWELPI